MFGTYEARCDLYRRHWQRTKTSTVWRCPSRQPIFSPRPAHIQSIFGTPQIELKLTPRIGHHTSTSPLEAFGVTTNGLAYRGQQTSGGQILHGGLWPSHMSWSAKTAPRLARTPSCFSCVELTSQVSRSLVELRSFAGLTGNTITHAVSSIVPN